MCHSLSQFHQIHQNLLILPMLHFHSLLKVFNQFVSSRMTVIMCLKTLWTLEWKNLLTRTSHQRKNLLMLMFPIKTLRGIIKSGLWPYPALHATPLTKLLPSIASIILMLFTPMVRMDLGRNHQRLLWRKRTWSKNKNNKRYKLLFMLLRKMKT